VLAPGGPDQIAGALGAWLAGAAFVMLDPVNPEHSAAACAAARPSVVLAAHELVDAAHDVCGAPVLNMDSIADQGVLAPEPIPDGRLAYVGLTSDSTGKPRPVAVQHGGLRSLCAATRDLLGAQGAALCAMSPTLDGYVWFTLAPLALGRTVLIRDGSEPAVGESDVRPTTSLSTPAQLVAGGDTLDEVPTVIVQGEPVSASLTRGWSPARRLVNAYGATEVTCVCAWTDWKRDDSTATLGRPIINSRVYVLDQDLDPVGPGVTGEIYVAGPGVARGYPGEAGLTASRFVPDPFGAPGSRMYRTGDQARWNAHGFLEFIGRLQDEVTIRGFRLNLAAVERAALELAEVRSAAAMTDERGDILGLALVPAPGASPTPEKIRAELGARRADYTVPTAVEILDEMPLDSNGKIDRLVLREVLADTRVQAAPGREPQTDVERQIAAVWSSVLGATVDDVELTFFEAGGRSLLVGRLVRLLRETIDAPFTLAAILDDPTIRGLAEFVEANL
jgi:acyl-coenzyme A synthetase/AMP-(fatty) acid ligase